MSKSDQDFLTRNHPNPNHYSNYCPFCWMGGPRDPKLNGWHFQCLERVKQQTIEDYEQKQKEDAERSKAQGLPNR